MRTISTATAPRLGYYRNDKGQLFEAAKLHKDRSVTVRRTCTGRAIRVSWALFHERFTWASEAHNNRPELMPTAAQDDDPRGSMKMVAGIMAAFAIGLLGIAVWACGCLGKVEW